MASHPPWVSGPGEILRHALELLKTDSDINRRLAMISIDNAVELMIEVYLGLPKRITGLKIPRKQYQPEFPFSILNQARTDTGSLANANLSLVLRPKDLERHATNRFCLPLT